MKTPKKVFIGMSGGVDSSVSAAILKREGYDVTGVFIKVWQPDFLPCNWKEERQEAMRVCAHLNIPFITLDLEKEYKKEVVDYMIEEYKKGKTPNPDVMCNRYVKFGSFFDYAVSKGSDYIATGHYARNFFWGSTPNLEIWGSNPQKGREVKLLKGKDQNKDQSYFLWTLTQRELSKTLFPVGNLEKSEVRKLAKKFKLPNSDKKDSQGLCFVGKIDMKEFLEHYIQQKEGNVLNEKGEVIGKHKGALFYTLGERHSFTISKKSFEDKAYFVVSKNIKNNTITVSNSILNNVQGSKKIEIEKTNWINLPPIKNKTYQAKIRYRGELLKIKIEKCSKNKAFVNIQDKNEAVASGQSIVVYDKDVCLGGGVVI